MSLSVNFPSVAPSLNLDFAGSERLDPRITFTRASNATYFDANGVLQTAGSGVARFDHNPTTLQSLGLLIEEQRTNLCLQSEDFSTAWAVTRSSVTTNTIVAPDGTLTGDTLVANTDNNTHFIRQGNFTFTSGVTYTFSVYVKAAGYSFVAIRGDSTSGVLGAAVYFSLTDGGVTQSASGVTTTSAAIGDGWYRLSVTATATGTESTGRPTVYLTNVGTGPSFGVSFAGNNSDGVYLWGAQLEVGAFPTSYIPTTGSAATRNADVATMTGTNFSSWYNQSEGTLYSETAVVLPNSGSNQFVARASANDYGNSVALNIIAGGNASLSTASGGVFDGIVSSVLTLTANVFAKFAGGYATNNLGLSLNGATVVTDLSATIPTTPNRLDIGSDHLGLNRIKAGYIRKLAYYPVRLSNDQLQALTR